jgi:hypothetical protein
MWQVLAPRLYPQRRRFFFAPALALRSLPAGLSPEPVKGRDDSLSVFRRAFLLNFAKSSMISVLFGGQSAIQQCVSDVVAIANEPRDHEQAKARIKELLDKVGQSFSVAQKLRDQLRVVCNVSRPLRQAILRRADRVTGGETSQGLITVGPPVPRRSRLGFITTDHRALAIWFCDGLAHRCRA